MRALCVFLLLVGGCYSPQPPAGAYRCDPEQHGNCPVGQHCQCGLCVNQDNQAACSFSITVDKSPAQVAEHELFSVTVQALAKDGTPAVGFGGTVQLGATWGDVQPGEVTLSGGVAQANISLNRETLPPQVAYLNATFGDNVGKSAGIQVTVPPFVIDDAKIEAPFGWASGVVAEAAVAKVGDQFRMYFVGLKNGNTAFGVATSSDGKSYVPNDRPILSLNDSYSPAPFTPMINGQPAYRIAYSYPDGIATASSADGIAPFTMNGVNPALVPTDCAYCTKMLGFPQVIPDPAAPDGPDRPWLMYFSALRMETNAASIGRARSTDGGQTWVAEGAPLLSGDLNGETVLLSPRVWRDGTVYKMLYSFARSDPQPCTGTGQGTCAVGQVCLGVCVQLSDVLDPFAAFCDGGVRVDVGYATSSDGDFWTRSLSNPVLSVTTPGLPLGTHAIMASSVLPADGSDPSTGARLYFSIFRRFSLRCVPNGIWSATRK